MPLNLTFKSLFAVILTLIPVIAGMSFLVFSVPIIHDKLLGLFIFGFGVFNIFLYKIQGRVIFKWGHAKRGSTFDYWGLIGERGTQILYLGIGFILATGGLALFIESLGR